MTIAVADSWAGRDTSATLDIPVAGIEIGDIIVVFTFCAGSGTPDVPFDDAANVYEEWMQSVPDATFTATAGIASALCETVPTQISVSNSAGAANDVAAVVLRVTHDGTGWLDSDTADYQNTSLDDPTSATMDVSAGMSGYGEYPGPGSVLLLAALTHDGATTTLAPEAGWTEEAEEEDAASGLPYSVVYQVVTERLSPVPSHQWTTGAARDYAIITAAFTENVADPVSASVGTAPTTPVTGTTLEPSITTRFPDSNLRTFHVLVHASDIVPSLFNSEIIRVIGETGGVWTIERGQSATRAQSIEAGWIIRWDHLYDLTPGGLLESVASEVLNEALHTIPWP